MRHFSSDQTSDGVQGKYTKVDIKLNQKITNNLSVSLDLNNITNSEDLRQIDNRAQGWQLYDYSNKYGMSANLGVRLDL